MTQESAIEQKKDALTISEQFLSAERFLQSIASTSDSAFCDGIKTIAANFGRVDALYICLYESQRQMLHFVYNYCGETFDTPESFPLGHGPTSWVIRNGKSLVIQDSMKPIGLKFRRFGNKSQVTHSELHLPLIDYVSGASEPFGVFSVQANPVGAYSESEVLAFEWLALRVGALLIKRTQGEDFKLHSTALKAARDSAMTTAKKAIDQLNELSHAIKKGEFPLERKELSDALEQMQMVINRWVYAPVDNPLDESDRIRFATLSKRELEVLKYVSEGLTNPRVADLLSISVDTVKSHASSAFRKAGLVGRSDAIRFRDTIIAVLATRMGDQKFA